LPYSVMQNPPLTPVGKLAHENAAPRTLEAEDSGSLAGPHADLIIVLDRSNSMAPMHRDAMMSANRVIHEQRRLTGQAAIRMSVWVFTTVPQLIFQAASPQSGWLTPQNYVIDSGCGPDSGTALFDAVCAAIHEAENRPGNNKVLVVVSDAEDNKSKITPDELGSLVAGKMKLGWRFLFIGSPPANGLWRAATGLPADSVLTFRDRVELVSVMRKVSTALVEWRSGQPLLLPP